MSDDTLTASQEKSLSLYYQLAQMTFGHTVHESIEALASALAVTVGIACNNVEAADTLLKNLAIGMSQVVRDRWTEIGHTKVMVSDPPSTAKH